MGEAAVKQEEIQQASEETPTEAANDVPAANGAPLPFEKLLADVPLQITVELGRVRLSLREIGQHLVPGAVIPLSKVTGESLDIRINDRLVARGEAVAIGERYGIRMVEILDGVDE
ncbi:MAG: FliM/FliN family flagellar motor switch protein [Nannocystaceae bacterium]|nr:FliM/FliN family flagellar motor switch protein [bacterium]